MNYAIANLEDEFDVYTEKDRIYIPLQENNSLLAQHILNEQIFISRLRQCVLQEQTKYEDLPKCPFNLEFMKGSNSPISNDTLHKYYAKIKDSCEELSGSDTVYNFSSVSFKDLMKCLGLGRNIIQFIKLHLRIIAYLSSKDDIKKDNITIELSTKQLCILFIYGLLLNGDGIKSGGSDSTLFTGSTIYKLEWIIFTCKDDMIRGENSYYINITDDLVIECLHELSGDRTTRSLVEFILPNGDKYYAVKDIFDNESFIYNASFGNEIDYNDERYSELYRLNKVSYIKELYRNKKYILSDDQVQALINLLGRDKVHLLTGPGGTGKTTLLKHLSESDTFTWLYLATTGKATIPLMNDGIDEVYTISSFYFKIKNMSLTVRSKGEFTNRYINSNIIIVVDEASMLSSSFLKQLNLIIYTLETSLYSTVHKLILTGDKNQLPPVGSGGLFNSLCDICSSKNISNICYTELTTSHRFKNAPDPEGLVNEINTVYRKQHYGVVTDEGTFKLLKNYTNTENTNSKVVSVANLSHLKIRPYTDKNLLHLHLAKLCVNNDHLVMSYTNDTCNKITYLYSKYIRGELNSIANIKIENIRRELSNLLVDNPTIGDKVYVKKTISSNKNLFFYGLYNFLMLKEHVSIETIDSTLRQIMIDIRQFSSLLSRYKRITKKINTSRDKNRNKHELIKYNNKDEKELREVRTLLFNYIGDNDPIKGDIWDIFIDKALSLYGIDENPMTSLTKGEVGRIIEVHDSFIVCDFDGRMVTIYKAYSKYVIELAAALTIHKCQGSQAKLGHLVVDSFRYEEMYTSSLMYTGVTRGREGTTIYYPKNSSDTYIHTISVSPITSLLLYDFLNIN